jgi:hypothetical protein
MKQSQQFTTSDEYLSPVPAPERHEPVRETKPNEPAELARTLLQVIALSLLIAASRWIIRPFVAAILWAVAACIAT